MHQLFPSRRRNTQAPADCASQPSVPGLEMERRELAEVEFDRDEDYGWVHFDDHEQLGNSQISKASATESKLNEKSNEDSRKADEGTTSHVPDDIEKPHGITAAQDPQEPPIEGPSADRVTESNCQDLLASIAKNRAALQQEMQESESARTHFLEHIQSLEQALRERGNKEAHTLREAEQNFRKQLQAQSQKLNDLNLKLQSQHEQHEQQIHAALEDVSQKTQGQNTFVLEKISGDFAAELKQLNEKISSVEQDLQSTLNQRLSTQADAVELALEHERSAREYEQRRLAEDLRDQKTGMELAMKTALEAESARNEQAIANLQQGITKEIEVEVEHININIGDALRILKAEVDGKRDALAANVDNAFDECKRIENALQTEASKRTRDTQALEARLKEVEQSHAKDVLVLKELLDKIQEEFSVMNEWNQHLQAELLVLREEHQADRSTSSRKTDSKKTKDSASTGKETSRITRAEEGDDSKTSSSRKTGSKKSKPSASTAKESARTTRAAERQGSQAHQPTQPNVSQAADEPRYTENQHDWYHAFSYRDDFYLRAVIIIAVLGTLACM